MGLFSGWQLGFVALLSVFAYILWGIRREARKVELHVYRSLVPTPEDLLSDDVDFSIVRRPNENISYVEVCGRKLESQLVFSQVMRDLCHLTDLGYKTHIEYLFDKSEPTPPEVNFQELLHLYEEKLALWANDNQGKPIQTKPKAPYDFKRVIILKHRETSC